MLNYVCIYILLRKTIMSNLTPHIKMLITSLTVSKNLIVGGTKGAETELHKLLSEIVESEESDEKVGVSNVPALLLKLAKDDLQNNLPSEEKIKNWLLYEENFSGITFYNTSDGKLTFARLSRSLDLSSGYQYADNRDEAKAYSEARQSKDPEKIQLAENALKSKLPGNKLKYLHWIGNKPSVDDIEAFKEEFSEYF